MLFSKPKKAIGLDIGMHSVKVVQLSRSGGRLYVDEAAKAMVDRNRVNADPVAAHAEAVREALRNLVLPQCLVVAALAGQTVVIRYPRLANVPRDQMDAAVEREAGQNIPYDLNEVFLDWVPLDETGEGDQRQLKVLLVAAKREVIDSRVQVLQEAEVSPGILGVDSLALADAAEACDYLRAGETVALINIGQTSASIHFVKDGLSNFIRDVSWGSRELIQAIAKDRRCEFEEAERLLIECGREAPPQETAHAEEAPAAAAKIDDDPFGESPIAKAGSLLDPLDEEVGLGAPAARGMRPAAPDAKPVKEILQGPLARMVSEIRRSFDYYEHQLYERPVDRIILSGGIANLPIVGETLVEELGVETVEVADPASSALRMGDDASVADLRAHPAQFMVAIGLAARGMADL